MRNKILLSAFALLAICFSEVFALQGGPDTYGYVWRDSNEPNGPSFVWNDITTNAGAVQITGLADDNSVGPFTLSGWAFRYYWSDITTWKFGSNGWVGLDNNISNIAHCFPTIPTAGGSGDNFIAPYMTDLNYATGGAANPGNVWYYDNGADSLVIQWNNVPWWQAPQPEWIGSNTFQLILTMSDTSITFMYQDMDQANFNDTGGCAADMEVGIENITGNIGLEVFNESIPPDNYAVKFYYPQNSAFTVPDAQPDWNSNSSNAGQFFIAGATAQPESMVTNIKNVGNADITNTINVDGELRDQFLNAFWAGSTSLPSLTAGSDTTLMFPTPVTFTGAGQYTYKVTTSNSQDINPSNNENEVEISAVECMNDTMNLTYCIAYGNGNPPDGAIAWTGGVWNEGGGLYFEPPVYPVTIDHIDAFILGDGDLNTPMQSGYAIEIYDDNAPAGTGTLLSSDTIQAANAGENVWNTITLAVPVTITSGGFYIAWLQGGDGVAVGTEITKPISQRTYEILAGVWAGFRSNTTDEMMLNVHTTTTCPSVGVNDPSLTSISINAFPNPTNGLTAINFEIPALGDVSLSIVNTFGQTVYSEMRSDLVAGKHTLNYDTNNLASGIYFINMEFGSQKVTRKLVVNR